MSVTAIRTAVLYIAITASMRLMGKRQLGQLHPAELVVALLIADLAVIPMQDVDLPLLQGLLPIAVLVALELLLSLAMLRWPRFSRIVSGNPIPIIQNGKFLPHQLKRMRMPLEDLCEQLRGQDVFDPTTVHSAFIESSGQLSVYLKPSDSADTERLLLPVIADGAIVPWTAQYCALSDKDIARILKTEGVKQKQVLLLLCDAHGQHVLLKRRDAE